MLKLENVTKKFKGGKGINKVSFEIPQGSICGFVGDNGMGKTTTIKCIFQEYKIDEGKILYKDEEISGSNNLLNFSLFPDSNAIPLNYRLRDYAYYQTMLYKIPRNIVTTRFKEFVKIFELEGYEKKKLKQLSAGMLKRAMLICAMITDSEYLILDEPTANLDVDSRKEFLNILKWLNEQGKTIIITSHIIEELQEIVDFLIFIDDGEIKYAKKINNKKEKISDIYNKYRTSSHTNRVEELKKYVASKDYK
ncbi:ABC transporter ATP-binding protein [Spiroplasma endosymbiont of Panorpa germanica]|uniref:ABC transporter ATP-binding protein n=1 Tax=Spiroplasma endosymbiont of Panorpa germanica TaxID=3066314 RepID=UPI0030D5D09C